MQAKIVVLAGDGIGPEVTDQGRRILDWACQKSGCSTQFDEQLIGGISIDRTGEAVTTQTLDACRQADAILLGAVGGPKWSDPEAKVRPEQGLLRLRKELGLYANLRPVRVFPSLADASPLKPERVHGVDMLIVRELTGGLYFGEPRGMHLRDGVEVAIDTLEYSEVEIERVVRLAFELARTRRKQVCSVDKANVLESSRLWRRVAERVGRDYSDVRLEHRLVDSCAMQLITQAASFDVIVTENMFGDILTDEAAVLTGSLGLLPSASLGKGKCGLYEPIHGSAPDIAGKGIANPVGTILSAAMLLRHSLGLGRAADAVEQAVSSAIESGNRTRDLGGSLSTQSMGDRVMSVLQEQWRA